MGGSRRHRLAAVLVLIAAAAWRRPVAALDLGLQLQPGYNNTSTTSTDETGHRTHSETSAWLQRYRLTLDAPIYPQLVLSAGGSLDWNKGTGSQEGVSSEFDSKRWNGFGHLRLGGPILSGGLDYDRRDETASATTAGARFKAPRLVSESYGATIGWRPADLPSLDLQVHRLDNYDWSRRLIDRTSDDALVATRYQPLRPLELGLSLRAGRTTSRSRCRRGTPTPSTPAVPART
jgi:hypothetical protein